MSVSDLTKERGYQDDSLNDSYEDKIPYYCNGCSPDVTPVSLLTLSVFHDISYFLVDDNFHHPTNVVSKELREPHLAPIQARRDKKKTRRCPFIPRPYGTSKHNTTVLFLSKSSFKIEFEIRVGKSSKKFHLDTIVIYMNCDDVLFTELTVPPK